MQSYCFLDTETRSRTDISLGNDLYCRDAECRIVTWANSLHMSGAWRDDPVEIWQPWQDPRMPESLAKSIRAKQVIFVAHVATFDRNILLRALGINIPIERWVCTKAQAYSHGLPGALDSLGTVMGLAPDDAKLVDDKKLIDVFCIPDGHGKFIEPADEPVLWERFCTYAIRDTHALREIFKRLPAANFTGQNLELWHLDQLSNERGFQFDGKLAAAAVDFLSDAKRASNKAVAELSAGEVHAATQRNKLLEFLRRKYGAEIESLRAAEVREWLERDDLDPVFRLLLEQRADASKSSGAKYSRGLRMCGPGGRQRNTIQFNGAGRTGRDSGRGFQPHNMARPVLAVRSEAGRIELSPVDAGYIDSVIIPGIYSGKALCNPLVYGGPNEAGALALRHVITAAVGNELVVGDWKNIESRVLAWIADERWKLEAYGLNDQGKGDDLYKLLFSQFFGVAIETINDTERQSGKVSELAFGFGGGVGALVTMAAGYQMDLDPLAAIVLPRATGEQKVRAYKAWRRAFLGDNDFDLDPKVYQACDILKQTYRTTNANINQLRYDIDDAIKTSIRNPGAPSIHVGRCNIWCTGSGPLGWLVIELPSGRRLLYAHPQIRIVEEVDDDPAAEKHTVQRQVITFVTARGKQWRREKAWAGLFLENIVQAIANDVLRGARIEIHKDTLKVPAIAAYLAKLPEWERTAISLCVHDEVNLDVPRGSYTLKRLLEVMCLPLVKHDGSGEIWSTGLPLAAEGWSGPRYGKRKAQKV